MQRVEDIRNGWPPIGKRLCEDSFMLENSPTRKRFRFLGYGLFAVLVAYIDYRALIFARAVESIHPNTAHVTRVLAICAVIVFAASIVLDSTRYELTTRATGFLERRFDLALVLILTAAFVAIGSAMIQFGVRFFK
jgi:hypothetical protein